MTAAEIIAARVAPFWLPPGEVTRNAAKDAQRTLSRHYRKGDGRTRTQFNTGAIVVREGSTLALTECEPARRDSSLRLCAPTKARAAVIADVREYGPPLLAVLFRKGAVDVSAWVCCTADEVVFNGPDAPEEVAAIEDVVLLRGLPGTLRDWRDAVSLYRQAEADFSKCAGLYKRADKLATATGMQSDAVLHMLHRLRRVSALAYALAEPNGARQ